MPQRRRFALLKQPFELDALGDVTVSTPVLGQILQYNGTVWVNTALASATGLNEVIDDRVNALIVDGNGIVKTYDDTANTYTLDADIDAASLEFSAGKIRRAALTGDVIASAGSNTTSIPDNTVTYAKMQNVSATSRILGRKSASAGDPEECTLSEVLDFIGSAAQGDVLYRGASGWSRLGAGTSGYVLTTQGAGADPIWAVGGGGGVSDGDKGDITVSGSGSIWTIDAGVIGTSKLGGDITTAGKALLDDASASAQRTTLGLGTAATKAQPTMMRGASFISTTSGSALTTSAPTVAVHFPIAATIKRVVMIGGTASGSAVVDIKSTALGSYAGTAGSSICASAKPTISSGYAVEDTTLTGWTTSVAAGTVLTFSIDSVSTFTKLAVYLYYEEN